MLWSIPRVVGACHHCESAIALVAGAHSRDQLAHAGYLLRPYIETASITLTLADKGSSDNVFFACGGRGRAAGKHPRRRAAIRNKTVFLKLAFPSGRSSCASFHESRFPLHARSNGVVMLKKWILLTSILSLCSSGTLQANPLDLPDIVYIDGQPCNSACQSYMAWSAQALSARHRANAGPTSWCRLRRK